MFFNSSTILFINPVLLLRICRRLVYVRNRLNKIPWEGSLILETLAGNGKSFLFDGDTVDLNCKT
ncbi:hypothetical protein Q767_15615 [Flavobacterium enshiense DK69]|uniref:Uncharacterized protein n=1 Tax=Flavobacterium enshiense DK69 TaxID=1107311 RepID=A0A0A2MJ06_9FLAO|nr:hypothetical protein Q767_15615 [Flavobacterium enshiense DK69]